MIEWRKVRTYVVPPGLKDFKVELSSTTVAYRLIYISQQLTPFVTKKMEPLKGDFGGDPKGGFSGERYLNRWKEENGRD